MSFMAFVKKMTIAYFKSIPEKLKKENIFRTRASFLDTNLDVNKMIKSEVNFMINKTLFHLK